jgi:hypothetical protein
LTLSTVVSLESAAGIAYHKLTLDFASDDVALVTPGRLQGSKVAAYLLSLLRNKESSRIIACATDLFIAPLHGRRPGTESQTDNAVSASHIAHSIQCRRLHQALFSHIHRISHISRSIIGNNVPLLAFPITNQHESELLC